jgi:acyl-CoA reductase-like NAD-dependent aldehyde dehydrogenase
MQLVPSLNNGELTVSSSLLNIAVTNHANNQVIAELTCTTEAELTLAVAKNHSVIMPDSNTLQVLNNLVGTSVAAAGQRCMAISVAVFVGDSKE